MLVAALICFAWRPAEDAAPDDDSVPPGSSSESSTVAGAEDPPDPEYAPLPGAPGGAVATAEEATGTTSSALWQSIDEESVEELPAYKEVVAGRALVRVTDVANLSGAWRVGDRIIVPIPQINETYTPVIERIESGPGDIRSYVGTLTVAAGRAHRFTITTGPKNLFANLSTPLGDYELVATGELGWLMPTIHMDQHVDYSQPDYIIPEGPGYLRLEP